MLEVEIPKNGKNETFVQISAPKQKVSICKRLSQAPVVDKFFLIGALSNIVGVAYLGAHMWLMRNGQTTYSENFAYMRSLHGYLQMYGFFGCFVLGFFFQAAPKLFLSPIQIPRQALILAPLILSSVFLAASESLWFLGQAVLSLVFLIAAMLIIRTIKSGEFSESWSISVLAVIGLLIFAAGALVNVGNPFTALVIFWGSVGACILSASQQFVTWVIGGVKLCGVWAVVFILSFIWSLALFSLGAKTYSPTWLSIGGASAAITVLLFCTLTQLWNTGKTYSDPLSFAVLSSFFWAFIGSVLLALVPSKADLALHIWTTGWGTTLILAVAPRIIGFLSGRDFFSQKFLFGLLAIWQIVPLGRGIPQLFPVWFSWVVAGSAVIVLVPWSVLLLFRCTELLRRQLNLRQGEKMPQC